MFQDIFAVNLIKAKTQQLLVDKAQFPATAPKMVFNVLKFI